MQAMGLAISARRSLYGLFDLVDLVEFLACFRRGMGAIWCCRIPCIFVCFLVCVEGAKHSH